MYTVAFIIKRRPELTLEEFLDYYRDRHGPLMIRHVQDKGLISYEHFPVDTSKTTGRYVSDTGPAYDAVSVYTFETEQQAEECWSIPEVIADSAAFIDFDTMVTLPCDRRTVFKRD